MVMQQKKDFKVMQQKNNATKKPLDLNARTLKLRSRPCNKRNRLVNNLKFKKELSAKNFLWKPKPIFSKARSKKLNNLKKLIIILKLPKKSTKRNLLLLRKRNAHIIYKFHDNLNWWNLKKKKRINKKESGRKLIKWEKIKTLIKPAFSSFKRSIKSNFSTPPLFLSSRFALNWKLFRNSIYNINKKLIYLGWTLSWLKNNPGYYNNLSAWYVFKYRILKNTARNLHLNFSAFWVSNLKKWFLKKITLNSSTDKSKDDIPELKSDNLRITASIENAWSKDSLDFRLASINAKSLRTFQTLYRLEGSLSNKQLKIFLNNEKIRWLIPKKLKNPFDDENKLEKKVFKPIRLRKLISRLSSNCSLYCAKFLSRKYKLKAPVAYKTKKNAVCKRKSIIRKNFSKKSNKKLLNKNSSSKKQNSQKKSNKNLKVVTKDSKNSQQKAIKKSNKKLIRRRKKQLKKKRYFKRKKLINKFLKSQKINESRLLKKITLYSKTKTVKPIFHSLVVNYLEKDDNKCSGLKNTIGFVRMSIYYNKLSWGCWRSKRKIFRRWFERQMSKYMFYNVSGKTKASLNFLDNFYKRYGMLKAFSVFIKYSYLIESLKSSNRKFIHKDNKHKKTPKRSVLSKSQKLKFFNYLSNVINRSGKSAKSRNFIFRTVALLKFNYKADFINNYIIALGKVRPVLSYKLLYTGGKKYKIPVLMQVEKSYRIAGRWFSNGCIDNRVDPSITIVNNIKSTLANNGPIIKRRDEYHKSAFENKSYTYLLRHLKKGF